MVLEEGRRRESDPLVAVAICIAALLGAGVGLVIGVVLAGVL
jgi:hypothetical protein